MPYAKSLEMRATPQAEDVGINSIL